MVTLFLRAPWHIWSNWWADLPGCAQWGHRRRALRACQRCRFLVQWEHGRARRTANGSARPRLWGYPIYHRQTPFRD